MKSVTFEQYTKIVHELVEIIYGCASLSERLSVIYDIKCHDTLDNVTDKITKISLLVTADITKVFPQFTDDMAYECFHVDYLRDNYLSGINKSHDKMTFIQHMECVYELRVMENRILKLFYEMQPIYGKTKLRGMFNLHPYFIQLYGVLQTTALLDLRGLVCSNDMDKLDDMYWGDFKKVEQLYTSN